RTEKLSPVTPMVLRNSGRVGRRRFSREVLRNGSVAGDFVFCARPLPNGRLCSLLYKIHFSCEDFSF
ncbi:MAG TPA: hypothetical protein K8W07_02910, partial [Bacteroides togonis]|nr:hypothetical protein [Bacteroides togonis]